MTADKVLFSGTYKLMQDRDLMPDRSSSKNSR